MQIAARNGMFVGGGGIDPGPVSFETQFTARLYSGWTSNKTIGIYSATAINSAIPIVIDWGDGTTDTVRGDISQLTHTYADYGTYTVGISDNISTFALSANDSTWYGTTTSNTNNIQSIIKISSNVTSIPAYGCCQLNKLVSIYAGDTGALSLGENAFADCSTQAKAPYDFSGRTITTIPNSCFRGCTYLTTFSFPKGTTSIKGSAFRRSWCSGNLGNIEIPEGVTSIGSYAFANCEYLTSVVIPSTVTVIDTYAFADCQRLYTMWVNRLTAPTANWMCFGGASYGNYYTGYQHRSDGTNRLIVPVGATGYDSGYWASPLCTAGMGGFTLVEADAIATQFEVQKIGSVAYKTGIYSATAIDSTKLTVVDWGDGSTSEVTGDISQLTHTYSTNAPYTVRISDNISSLALSANDSTWYYGSTVNMYVVRRLTTLSQKITSIPAYGFYHLDYLEYVNAGSSGNLTLGEHAFEGVITSWSGEPTIVFDFSGRTIAAIPAACFKGWTYLADFQFPQGLTSIGEAAFQGTMSQAWITGKVVTIPEGVLTCDASALRFGAGISELVLPSTLTSLGNLCLLDDTNLATIRCNALVAPSVTSTTFGEGHYSYRTDYAGYNTKPQHINTLYVPVGATGYNASYWGDSLLNIARNGFTKVEVTA